MELMTRLKEMIPWKRKPVETHEVLSLRDDINRLFDRFLLSPFEWTGLSGWASGVDVEETEQDYVVRVEVPGLDPAGLHVTVRGRTLHIDYAQHEDRRNGHASHSRYAAFHRAVSLPDGVDGTRAEAACKHGLLTVRIPWSRESGERIQRIDVAVE